MVFDKGWQQLCGKQPRLECEVRLQGTRWASADKKQLAAAFTYLDFCLEQVVKDNELGALRQALQARPASCCVA